ncbi:MAG: sigma-70 family RNA polymerase sigma factor [Planctomycetes bacterium]|nr:sigma-70 family RNA polymerase sigma factor [Planctomycetota bacterium]
MDTQPFDSYIGPFSTDWSRIQGRDFEYLVRRFWRPVRRFLADRLPSTQDAEDATQDLFLAFFERNLLARADAAKGSFRSFLFHVARQFLIDRYRANAAAKRGADRTVPLGPDTEQIESDNAGPFEELEREWYLSLLETARAKLKARFALLGKPEVYRAFQLFYFGDGTAKNPSYEEICKRLALMPGQVKNHIFRTKHLFLEEVRAAIGEYARTPEELEEELAELRRFLEHHRLHGLPPPGVLTVQPVVEEE